jgi:hypothetical protein
MSIRFSAILLGLAGCCLADTLILRDGSTVRGDYAGGDTRHVRIMVGGQVQTYDLDQVSRLEFSGGDQGANLPRRSERDGDRDRDRDQTRALQTEREYDQQQPRQNAGSYAFEIPAGSVLVVRMIDDVDSERDTRGKTFRASLDEPVIINGEAVLPRGAEVTAKLVDDKQSGKFAGRAELTLALVTIQANGRTIEVTTGNVTQASASRGARTAKTVGGTTALGAIIGGIAGGGAGAAIGAASGAAVGGGVQVLTKGQRVRIPSETRLSFTLQQPARV